MTQYPYFKTSPYVWPVESIMKETQKSRSLHLVTSKVLGKGVRTQHFSLAHGQQLAADAKAKDGERERKE